MGEGGEGEEGGGGGEKEELILPQVDGRFLDNFHLKCILDFKS